MSHKQSKKIRKELFNQGLNIQAEPYSQSGSQIISAKGRRIYQAQKRTK